MEGTARRPLQAIDAVRRNVSTCDLDAATDDVRRELEGTASDYCLVLGPDQIVLGRVRPNALTAEDRRAQEVMEPGPTTIRPDDELAGLIARMQQRHVETIIVTDPDGRLIGVLDRIDGERILDDQPAAP